MFVNEFRSVQTRPRPTVFLDVVPLFPLLERPRIEHRDQALVLSGNWGDIGVQTRIPWVDPVLEALAISARIGTGYLSFTGEGPAVSVPMSSTFLAQLQSLLKARTAPVTPAPSAA